MPVDPPAGLAFHQKPTGINLPACLVAPSHSLMSGDSAGFCYFPFHFQWLSPVGKTERLVQVGPQGVHTRASAGIIPQRRGGYVDDPRICFRDTVVRGADVERARGTGQPTEFR